MTELYRVERFKMTPEQRKLMREKAKRMTLTLPFLDQFEMQNEVKRILATSSEWSPMIIAIKYVRSVTGWLLVESKKYVEAVRDGKPLPEPPGWPVWPK